MALYSGSPMGEIRGKLNGTVALKWKRKLVIRKYAVPSDRGTLLKYQQFKDGEPGVIFSLPQFNLRRCILNPLLKCSRDHLEDWIFPIWKLAAQRRHLQMSGLNLLLKDNITTLYASMDKTIEYDPATNKPDLTKLQMSTGELEGTNSLTCTYDTATGLLDFVWDQNCYANGQASDIAKAIILAKPLLDTIGRDGNWEPALMMYGPTGLTNQVTRGGFGTGHGHMTIPAGYDAADLTAFIFFFAITNHGNIYSLTKSVAPTAP